jgi:hypothetical protein
VKRRTSKVAPVKGDFESQQERRRRSAAKRVVPWGELQQDDYDFGRWGKDEKLRDAGCAYEFAREWPQFRCWILLTGRKCEPSGIGTWIEGIRPGLSYLSNSGWVAWLRGFADELAANKSFADVLQTDETKVRDSLAALPNYSLFPKAVELPGRHIITHGDAQPEFGYPGSQVLQIEVCWRHYRNTEIGEEMKILTGKLRPAEEPEPPKKRANGSEALPSPFSML